MNKKSIIYRCLVASLCLVSMVVMTYSWFNRSNGDTAKSLGFERVVNINEDSSYITAETYYSKDDGKTYTEKVSKNDTDTSYQTITEKLEPGKKLHFRTTIYTVEANKDTHSSKTAKVTVVLENSQLAGNVKVGTLTPVNQLVNSNSESVTLAKNVTVPVTSDGESKTGAILDWYISLPSSGGSGDASLSNITLGNLLIYQV